MKLLKQKYQYFIALLISVIGLVCMFFAFLVVQDVLGINGFVMATVSGLGAWWVLANIFHVLVFMLLLFIATISILEILDGAGVIKFSISIGRVTSYILIKLALIMLMAFLVVEAFLLWFTILANDIYGLVFGAGVFVELGISLVGFLLLLYFERTTDTQKVDDTTPEIVIETDENSKNDNLE